MGERGSMILSDTWGNFGALIGIGGRAQQHLHHRLGRRQCRLGYARSADRRFHRRGAPPAGQLAQCSSGGCDTLGANFWAIPNTVPAGVTTGGLVPGQPIDQAMLLALNPGLTIQQISNMLVPRLGRSMYERGHRDRYNARRQPGMAAHRTTCISISI